MAEHDQRPDPNDPVGAMLRKLAADVGEQAGPGDLEDVWRRVGRRKRRRRLRVLVPSFSGAGAVAVALVLILVVFAGGVRAPRPTPSAQTVYAGVQRQATTVAGIRFVSYDLKEIAKRAPHVAVHLKTLRLPFIGNGQADVAYGDGSVFAIEAADVHHGPAKSLGVTAPHGDCSELLRLNAQRMAVTGSVPLRLCANALALKDGSVWVLSSKIGVRGYTITRIDARTVTVAASTVIDGGPDGVTPFGETEVKNMLITATTFGVLAAVPARNGATQLVTLDPRSLAVRASVVIPVSDGLATAVATSGPRAWVGTDQGFLYRIDTATGKTTRVRQLGEWIYSLTGSGKTLWAAVMVRSKHPTKFNFPGVDTVRLDARTGAIRQDLSLPLDALAAADGQLWGILAAPVNGKFIQRINPATGVVTGATATPSKDGFAFYPNAINAYHGSAWVVNSNLGTLTRVAPVSR